MEKREMVIPTDSQFEFAMGVIDKFNELTSRPIPRKGTHAAILADLLCRRESLIKLEERARCAKVCSDRAAAEGSDSTDAPRAVESEACAADILALS